MSPVSIADELRRSLVSGRLRPGAELSQVTLAAQFGVSRIPIRDALRVLEGEGLVEITPNRGARVLSLTQADLCEIYDLRVMLECDSLRRAISNATTAQIDEIDRVRRRSDIDANTSRWSEGDMEFHVAIYRLAARPRQLGMIEGLRRTCQTYVSAYATIPQQTPRWLADHLAIITRMREGNVEGAESVLRNHIYAAKEHLLTKMAPASAGSPAETASLAT